jgi:hypothetical protein
MRLRSFLAAFVVASAATAAHAQFAIYGTFSPLHATNVSTGSTYSATTNSYTPQYASFWANGVGGGITYNFVPIGPVKLGIDLRGSTKPGTAGADTAMAGFKVGFKLPLVGIKPYLQASGGYLATRSANLSTYSAGGTSVTQAGGTVYNHYAAWEFLGGVDYSLVHFVDLRIIEIGGGKAYSADAFSTNFPSANIFTVNTGIVVHF